MGKKFRAYAPEQGYLLPPDITEFVPKGHVAHFVRELTRQELDLREIYGSYEEERGAPPHEPSMMTALLLYAYTQGVYSSRKIARGCEERMDFVAVTALKRPDFRAIALFRKRHLNALERLFVQVVKLCMEAKLVKLGHVAIDGTKIKANASPQKGKRYKSLVREEAEIEAEVKRWLSSAEALDAEEDREFGAEARGDENPEWMKDPQERLKRIREAKESLERKDREAREKREQEEKDGIKGRSREKKRTQPKDNKCYNFTDPDSEVMKAGGRYIQGYNAQAAVDAENQIIVATDVITNAADRGQLIPMLKKVKENCKKNPAQVSADCGYCSELDLQSLERKRIRGYVAITSNRVAEPPNFPKNSYRAKMWRRLRRGGKNSLYWIRSQTVEPVFGIIKAVRYFTQFFLRGVENVKAEFAMVAMAHNILKLRAARSLGA